MTNALHVEDAILVRIAPKSLKIRITGENPKASISDTRLRFMTLMAAETIPDRDLNRRGIPPRS
jgi:hypothetical protein